MTRDSRYHPDYYLQDRAVTSAKVAEVNSNINELRSLSGRASRRAWAKHEKKLQAEYGSISREDLGHRIDVMNRFAVLHGYWGTEGRYVIDVSGSTYSEDQEIDHQHSGTSFDVCPPVYVHFGNGHGLTLAKLPGELVDGVYIIPTPSIGVMNVPQNTLIAVCRRGGRSHPTDSLEKLYLNASAMTMANLHKGVLEFADGEELMENDPAVKQAFKWALREYRKWLTTYGAAIKELALMRSLPPIDEPWDAWEAIAKENAASGHATA